MIEPLNSFKTRKVRVSNLSDKSPLIATHVHGAKDINVAFWLPSLWSERFMQLTLGEACWSTDAKTQQKISYDNFIVTQIARN